jgi:uncharacterized protein YndB with AHSA1/START domain
MTHDLTIKRHLSLSPAECFALWSEPESLATWWGPKDAAGVPFESEVGVWSATPHTSWSIKMTAPDGTEYLQGGEIIDVDPPHLLRFSFYWIENGQRGPTTEISIRFDPDGDGTLMTFVQKGFADAETRNGHMQGWNECIDRLVDLARASGREAA